MDTTENKIAPLQFDCVIMLTWSDWKTEPRSNRYHYATRFARHVPVFFVQPDSNNGNIYHEEVAIGPGKNITIVHCPPIYDGPHMAALEAVLFRLGGRNALLWVYNVWFAPLVIQCRPAMVVFHATEDYFTIGNQWRVTATDISADVKQFLALADVVIAVSEGVADSYRQRSGCGCRVVVIPNGCDFEFWRDSAAFDYTTPETGRPVVLYQGGINSRLDFGLLSRVAAFLPEWDLWLCGRLAPALEEWRSFSQLANVRYIGELDPTGIAQLSRQARVGIIPFKQDDLIWRSLPLKAYEYVACGLPVVSVPIEALGYRPDIFCIERDAEGFARAITKLSPSRNVPSAVEARLTAAQAQSYERRFDEARRTLQSAERPFLRASSGPLNVLMIYDDRSTHVGTIKEHLDAFGKYSKNNYFFMAGTGRVQGIDDVAAADGPDLDMFDAIAVHYSVRLSIDNHMSPGIAALLEAYKGMKFLFIQDEYDTTETARRWIERLGIDAVFTNVPLDQIDAVYPRSRFSRLEFVPTLTGYVPEDPLISRLVKPLSGRTVRIGYRGRRLPHHYGRLGYEKLMIGLEMKQRASAAGIEVDIEVDEDKRIYGTGWYAFLGSCRATLGTESGSNVFDDDGSLAALSSRFDGMPFEVFEAEFLRGREDVVKMNQISPKVFEAIRLRTALILFEGQYSGVLTPNRHYIPLKKDFSNASEVFELLEDSKFLAELTDRAYNEIIASGRYSYRNFVSGVDDFLARRCPHGSRYQIMSMPAIIREPVYGNIAAVRNFGPLVATSVYVGREVSREDLAAALKPVVGSQQTGSSQVMRLPQAIIHLRTWAKELLVRGWRRLPAALRHNLAGALLRVFRGSRYTGWSFARSSAAMPMRLPIWARRPLVRGWRLLPVLVRYKLADHVFKLQRR